jgi:uncharacterized protein (TIGR02302 family)
MTARDPGVSRLRRRLRLARFALLWESAWPLFWPIPALLAVFVGLALLRVPESLPGWLHLAGLVVLAGVLLYFVVGLRRIRRPGEAQARHRLERDSGFTNGPLDLLADTLATGDGDPVAQSLWLAYRRRLAAVLNRLGLPLPGPVMARHDPLGLRFVALMLLAVALPGGWQDAPQRIGAALHPNMNWLVGDPPSLQVWLTPPDYTRIAPILLENAKPGEPIEVPSGSKLLAELQGGRGGARLELAGKKQPFQVLDTASQRLETTIAAGGTLVIRQGWRRVAEWELEVIPNHAPTIGFAKKPDADESGRLRFDVEVNDQYGVAKAWIEVARPDRANRKSATVDLPMAGHPRHARQASWHDLTASPWAGLEVTLTPRATDDAGQTASGDPVTVTLPEHQFRHPVARALIAIRKSLAEDADSHRGEAIAGIGDIYEQPDRWGGDTVVALALSDIAARLAYDPSDDGLASVLDMLWQTALRLDDGDQPAANRAVEEAAQALQKALDNNAPDAEIDRLTRELKEAIRRMLQAMVQQAMKNGQPLPEPMPGQKLLSEQDLEKMLDQMADMARTGSRDAARQALQQLQQMLDNLRSGRPSTASREQMEQSRKLSEAMQNLLRDQQQLLDQTFRANQDPAKRGQPDQGGADQQDALRHRLGDVMQQLGDLGADIPDAMGEAEQAMRDANGALGEGDLDGAIQAQTRALEKLRQGQQQANQAMAQALGAGAGVVRVPGQPGANGQTDPLGRPIDRNGSNGNDSEQTKIPTEADLQKARDVLDELRRREGQAHRPRDEHEYIDRLLKQLF